MDIKELVGFMAGILTTFSGAPQLYYSYKYRDVQSFTLKFLIPFLIGLSLWTLYGVFIKSLPVIIFNIIALCLWLPIFALKLTLRHKKEK
jgi:MtN3 and saliva related transmembrane protein